MIKLISAAFLIILLVASPLFAAYDANARLLIKNINFCVAKPQGMGRFEPAEERGFKAGEDAYLYMEAHNCKAEKKAGPYEMYLLMDMDIYYEDGTLVYSEKDVKSFSPKSSLQFWKTYLWVMVETRYLQAGEYKVELTVHDKISEKSAFALKKFRVYAK